MLKQKLQQKLLQKLSPQQIQVIKLLEIPSYRLSNGNRIADKTLGKEEIDRRIPP